MESKIKDKLTQLQNYIDKICLKESRVLDDIRKNLEEFRAEVEPPLEDLLSKLSSILSSVHSRN